MERERGGGWDNKSEIHLINWNAATEANAGWEGIGSKGNNPFHAGFLFLFTDQGAYVSPFPIRFLR